ncbi:MAG: hemolysin family protein [Anaerolineales bacterium]
MTAALGLSLVAVLLILALQHWVTSVYYALSTASKKALRDQQENGHPRAKRALSLAEDAPKLLAFYQFLSVVLPAVSALIIYVELAPVIAPALDALSLSEGATRMLATGLLFAVYAVLMFMLGHQLPGAIISGRSDAAALMITPSARGIILGLAPLLRLSQYISETLGRALGGRGIVTLVTEEEIKILVEAGSEEGVIEDEERDMIYSVFRFGETRVREVMVPRIDIVAIELQTSLDTALDKIITGGHSRLPVYEESVDNIKGFLYAKDLLVHWRNKTTIEALNDVLRPPYFVPETMHAAHLLDEFQLRETHIAIVIDEYGGTAGLVTIEDLIEEIVGEIRDEYDFGEEAPYELVSEREYICSAGIDLDDLNELLDISLPTEDNDTLGGLIFSQLGEVPTIGDKITLQNVELEVLTVKGRRINKVRVTKLAIDSDVDEETPTHPDTTSSTEQS